MVEKRRCEKCREEVEHYTYALVLDDDERSETNGQNRVIRVCIKCKAEMGIFFEPKGRK